MATVPSHELKRRCLQKRFLYLAVSAAVSHNANPIGELSVRCAPEGSNWRRCVVALVTRPVPFLRLMMEECRVVLPRSGAGTKKACDGVARAARGSWPHTRSCSRPADDLGL